MPDDDLQAAIALAAGADVRDGTIVGSTGQVGVVQPEWLDKRILLQTEVWIDRHARSFRLEDMSVDYRTNVIVFLQGYEETWAALALLYVTGDLLLGNVSSEEGARQHRLVGLLTPGWMLQTPLVRRLLALNREAAFDRTDDEAPS